MCALKPADPIINVDYPYGQIIYQTRPEAKYKSHMIHMVMILDAYAYGTFICLLLSILQV